MRMGGGGGRARREGGGRRPADASMDIIAYDDFFSPPLQRY